MAVNFGINVVFAILQALLSWQWFSQGRAGLGWFHLCAAIFFVALAIGWYIRIRRS